MHQNVSRDRGERRLYSRNWGEADFLSIGLDDTSGGPVTTTGLLPPGWNRNAAGAIREIGTHSLYAADPRIVGKFGSFEAGIRAISVGVETRKNRG
jgi:hypothetical protein